VVKGTAMTKLAVGLQEAQEMTGISHFTLRRMVRLRKIKAARVGRRILIPVSELENLVKPGAAHETGEKGKRRAATLARGGKNA